MALSSGPTPFTVDENVMGAVIGMVTVTDADDARHPHGQHTYTFEVDGEASDQFEITADGYLKLKDDASLNHETASQITLTVTATDMAVSEPAEGEDATTASVSEEIHHQGQGRGSRRRPRCQ